MEIEGLPKKSFKAAFRNRKLIASCSSGNIYQAIRTKDNLKVALKKITMRDYIEYTNIFREFSILQTLRHSNIIELHSVVFVKKILYFVMELMDMDLAKYIMQAKTSSGSIKPSLVKNFMHQILTGIAHCHSFQIVHRDIKPDNLLVNQDHLLKIADFGISKKIIDEYNWDNACTLPYRAPEMLLNNKDYTLSVDIWSIGCVMAELYTLERLITGATEIEALQNVCKLLGTPGSLPPEYHFDYPGIDLTEIVGKDPDALDLFSNLIKYDSNDRISTEKALNHSYFKN